jgi:hypothetical protein
MPRRVVLHVGTHKTGSTSLQHFLRSEAAALLETVDAWYPPGFVLPTAHSELPLLAIRLERMWPARLRLPEVRDPAWLEAARRHVRRQVDAATVDKLVYSHEDLSYIRFDDELERLASLLDGAEVRIVVFLRERQEFLRSYRRQLEATGFSENDDPTSFAYVEGDSWLIDYEALLDGYRRQFGSDRVEVLDYDAVVAADGSVIPAFLGLLGIPKDLVPPHAAYVMNRTGTNLRPTEEQLRQLRQRLAEQSRS